MKNKTFFGVAFGLAALCFLSSCNKERYFVIKGKIASANAETIYMERRDLDGVKLLDSVKLSKKGTFSFREKAPVNPDFYQLRLGKQTAVFAIDSTETLDITADADNFFHSFTVHNSVVNKQIKEVDNLFASTVAQIKQLEQEHGNKTIDDAVYLNRLDTILSNYKKHATNYVLANPSGAVAYYTLFRKIDDYLVFNPYTKEDYPVFGAVATAWTNRYPETPRTKHLHDFAINAFKVRKKQEEQAQLLDKVTVVSNANMPDIRLKSVSGKEVSLSSLQGKVVLIDFTAYSAKWSPKHNMQLSNLYNQFRARGFEIYQVSFDSDEHFWKNAASNLPWKTVHDPQSVYSSLLSSYNVKNLPTGFIVNAQGTVVARVEDYSTVEAALKRAF